MHTSANWWKYANKGWLFWPNMTNNLKPFPSCCWVCYLPPSLPSPLNISMVCPYLHYYACAYLSLSHVHVSEASYQFPRVFPIYHATIECSPAPPSPHWWNAAVKCAVLDSFSVCGWSAMWGSVDREDMEYAFLYLERGREKDERERSVELAHTDMFEIWRILSIFQA